MTQDDILDIQSQLEKGVSLSRIAQAKGTSHSALERLLLQDGLEVYVTSPVIWSLRQVPRREIITPSAEGGHE